MLSANSKRVGFVECGLNLHHSAALEDGGKLFHHSYAYMFNCSTSVSSGLHVDNSLRTTALEIVVET